MVGQLGRGLDNGHLHFTHRNLGRGRRGHLVDKQRRLLVRCGSLLDDDDLVHRMADLPVVDERPANLEDGGQDEEKEEF